MNAWMTHKVDRNTMKYVKAAPSTVRSLSSSKGKNWTGAKYFSQTTNAASDTTPMTIMTMMLALSQEWVADETRLNGSVMRVKPAVMRIAPSTRIMLVS